MHPSRALCSLVLCLAAIRPIGAQTPVRTNGDSVTVDFQDAELRVVLSALADAARRNVTFSDLPERRVTLRVREAVPRAEVLPLFRAVALANGVRVDEEGTLLRLSPLMPAAGLAEVSPDARLYVHRLKHVRAAKVAATLQAIFGGGDANPARNGGLVSQTLTARLQGERLTGTPRDTTSGVPAAAGERGIAARLTGSINVVPDETTNALLVRALPIDWAVLEEAIVAMDLRPLQVLIEVLIAEVRESRDLDVRVTGAVAKNPDPTTRTTGTLGGEEASTSSFLLRLARGGALSTDAAISALATRGDVRVLSRPLLLAQNNLEAKMLVGSQRPFVQVFRSLPTDAGVRDQVVQYRDVGTSLAILPTINPDGYVSLQLTQEVSSATAETQFGAPVISTREASTHLFVKDGETAVLGGLVDRSAERTRTGIPWLSGLPWIGGLFGSTRATNASSELFLFVTPHIVASDEDLARIRGAVDAQSARPGVPLANPPVVPRKPPQ